MDGDVTIVSERLQNFIFLAGVGVGGVGGVGVGVKRSKPAVRQDLGLFQFITKESSITWSFTRNIEDSNPDPISTMHLILIKVLRQFCFSFFSKGDLK